MAEPDAFDAYLQAEIAPELASREAGRSAAVRRFFVWLAGGAAAGFAVGGASVGLFGLPPLAVLAFAGGFALIGAGIGYLPLAALQKETKAFFAPRVAAFFDAVFQHDVGSPPEFATFRKFGLAPSHDRSSFEDLLTGTRHGVDWFSYEAHLEEKRTTTDSKGRTKTTWVTVFHGQLCRISYPKPFLGVTVVARDRGIFNRLSRPGRDLQHVGLASSRFEKAFEAWSTDQVEARELLDPIVLERFLELERLFRGKQLRAAFFESALYVAVQTGNRFETGSVFRPLTDARRISRLQDEFVALFDLIDVSVRPTDGRLNGAFSVDDVKGRAGSP